MPIPAEILAVARPRNTFVAAYGKSKDRYAVRKYVGCRYDHGRHIPIKGPTIGHIRDGKFIPTENDPAFASRQPPPADLKDWAGPVLCDRVFGDVLSELKKEYREDEALKIWCVAVLRVCNPGARDYELEEMYESSFLSELHPGVALSKNTVSALHKELGRTCSRIVRFMRRRAEAIAPGSHILLDGTLKSDESRVNSLSDFSRKARTKGTRDISVLYAFDMDKMEPVCSKCYPGNMLDLTAYGDFVRECGVKRGVIVADKGFPASAAAECRKECPGLHYLNPVRRNSALIATHGMLDFDGVLADREGISFRKAKVNGGRKWLYSFRDASQAHAEDAAYLAKAKKDGTYDHAAYREASASFGTIVLECDLDLEPAVVYKMYEERWQIEIVMRYYKSACRFDETRVHSDYSVIGSEFCDFLATVLTFRLIREFDKARLLEKRTYSRTMALLRRAKKIRIGEHGEWLPVRMNPSTGKMLAALGLDIAASEQPKRRPGRPPKNGTPA